MGTGEAGTDVPGRDRDSQPEAPITKRGQKLLEDIGRLVGPNLWTGFREEQVALSILAIEAEARAATQERPQPDLEERLAFALEARDVQQGGSPHITPGNRFYREAAASLIALMPSGVAQERPPIDVERLARAVTSKWPMVKRGGHRNGPTPLELARAFVNAYEHDSRLAGGSVEAAGASHND